MILLIKGERVGSYKSLGVMRLGAFGLPINLGMIPADRNVRQIKFAWTLQVGSEIMPGMNGSTAASVGRRHIINDFVNDRVVAIVLDDFFFTVVCRELVEIVVTQDIYLCLIVTVIYRGSELKEIVENLLLVLHGR